MSSTFEHSKRRKEVAYVFLTELKVNELRRDIARSFKVSDSIPVNDNLTHRELLALHLRLPHAPPKGWGQQVGSRARGKTSSKPSSRLYTRSLSHPTPSKPNESPYFGPPLT